MNRTTSRNRFLLSTTVFLLMVSAYGCERSPGTIASDVPQVASVPLSVHAVDVGNVIGVDHSVPPMTRFAPNDEIIASVRTRGSGKNASLHAELVFQDGERYGTQTKNVSTDSPLITNFEFAREAPWPTGRYVVNVSLNRKQVVSQEIEVRSSKK
jgi:hypothetical protein